MNAIKEVQNSSCENNATNIEPSDIYGQDSDNNTDYVDNNNNIDLRIFDADNFNGNVEIFDNVSVGFDEDNTDVNQDILKYQRKNDKAALPKRAFNKKKAAAQKKAAVARYFDELD